MQTWRDSLLCAAVICALTTAAGPVLSGNAPDGGLYRIVDGKVDAQTYNGFRRYHAACNHCHGPDGVGSTFGPSLIDRPIDLETFRASVRQGVSSSPYSRMKGFAGDPNVEPYIEDILAYLQARADGALGRGRPPRLGR